MKYLSVGKHDFNSDHYYYEQNALSKRLNLFVRSLSDVEKFTPERKNTKLVLPNHT